jgi:hypothetical protein
VRDVHDVPAGFHPPERANWGRCDVHEYHRLHAVPASEGTGRGGLSYHVCVSALHPPRACTGRTQIILQGDGARDDAERARRWDDVRDLRLPEACGGHACNVTTVL